MHYVPQTYLKKFENEQEPDFVYRVFPSADFSPPEKVSIKSICYENNIYSLEGIESLDPQALENHYTNVYDKNYPLFNYTFLNLLNNPLPDKVRFAVTAWIVSMEMRNQQTSSFIFDCSRDIIIERYKQSKLHGSEFIRYRDQNVPLQGRTANELVSFLEKEERSRVALDIVEEIVPMTHKRMQTHSLAIITLSSDEELITSDKPIVVEKYGFNGIQKDGLFIYSIPLDSKRLLLLHPNASNFDNTQITPLRITEEKESEWVFKTNQVHQKQCSRYILGTRTSLESFQVKLMNIQHQRPDIF